MKRKQKIIGILGGMGPYATIHFFQRILEHTPIKKDKDHFRVLIDNQVKIPSRTRAVLYNEESPVPYMIESINNLEKIGADLVLVPCNSAHFFFEEVSKHINIPWVDMLECVANELTMKGFSSPLVLGGYVTTNMRTYSKYLPNSVYLTKQQNRIIEEIIEEIKSNNKASEKSKSNFESLIEEQSSKIDSIIFACTELPIAFGLDQIFDIPIFDSADIYAEESKNYGYF